MMSVGVVFLQPVRSSLAGVVVPSSSAQFCSSVSLDRCACRPGLSCSSQNGCQVQQLSSVSSMSKVSRQLSQRAAVILGVLPEPADQVASTIASFGLFIATQAFRHAASRSRLNARDKYR